MKVIDLLNKIANGEEVPKKIKWGANILIYNKKIRDYNFDDYDEYFTDRFFSFFNMDTYDFLNDEVEILDEEDEFIDIEEINNAYYHENQDRINQTFKNAINDLIKNQRLLINKINERNDKND